VHVLGYDVEVGTSYLLSVCKSFLIFQKVVSIDYQDSSRFMLHHNEDHRIRKSRLYLTCLGEHTKLTTTFCEVCQTLTWGYFTTSP
jgi:hypothetical protein